MSLPCAEQKGKKDEKVKKKEGKGSGYHCSTMNSSVDPPCKQQADPAQTARVLFLSV